MLCQGALALTPRFLSHGHQVVVGNIPQVLRSLGQRQGVGCDGGCVGTQEPSTCLLPQERVCLGNGGFLEDSRGLSPACPGSQGKDGRVGRTDRRFLTTLAFSCCALSSWKTASPWCRAMTTKAVSATVSSVPTKPPW